MTQHEINNVSVAYKKLSNGHSFWSADKKPIPLLVNATDIQDAVLQVTKCLNERLGGRWMPSRGAEQLIKKIQSDEDAAREWSKIEGFAMLTSWTSEAA